MFFACVGLRNECNICCPISAEVTCKTVFCHMGAVLFVFYSKPKVFGPFHHIRLQIISYFEYLLIISHLINFFVNKLARRLDILLNKYIMRKLPVKFFK